MKKIILYTAMFFAIANGTHAQVKKGNKNTLPRQVTAQKATTINTPASLNNWSSYNAKAAAPTSRTLTIADPTIITLNRRANGEPVPLNTKEILGVPKITYGLGNGQLLFRSRGATTSGTGTGNGLVGTGSGLGPVGTNGLSLGVNGKSPYAGPIMYGIIVTGLPAGTNNTEAARKSKKTSRQ